uniref:1-phosphofructokinase n=1 Tax=Globicatella sulfidifaciens TaxID=136093 RepID=UPI0023F0BBA9|nr:1-phosphofructokinase [Globicatella sulfidifaciens]
MIYTFTANLAIDMFIETNYLKPNLVNRTNYSTYSANGKGVNVSRVLKHFQIDSVVTGFKAGFTGDFIEEEMRKDKIETFLPTVDGITRINIFTKVLDENNEYIQVNSGPHVDDDAKLNILNYFEKRIKKGDFISINGSFPSGIDQSFIETLCKLVKEKGAEIIIDNSSDFVPELCKYEPYLIKPNELELCNWFDKTAESKKQFIELSKKLLEDGAQNILLSMGSEGAMLISKEKIISCNAPKGKVINTAMSGDALLGTYLSQRIMGESEEESLKLAVTAGSSTAFSDGLTDFKDIDELIKQVKVTKIEEEN